MKAGFWRTVKAAFNARPFGMYVPPNWIGLAAVAMLGFREPGFWVLGAGLELGYLALLVSNARFQRTVHADMLSVALDAGQAKIDGALAELADTDRKRYRDLERQCQAILSQQTSGGAMELLEQEGGLGRLLWVYLRLLQTRRTIERSMNELLETELRSAAPAAKAAKGVDRGLELLEGRIRDLQRRTADAALAEELKRSLAGQTEILQQRLANRKDGLGKLEFLEAELTRIEEQLKLIKEQASVASDSGAVASRIDQITAGLGGTAQWVREQQKIYGSVDLLEEPPPIAVPRAEAKRQTQ
jgi:hypothetical protein